MTTVDNVFRTAKLSEDGAYRYVLGRWWNPIPADRTPVADLWVMLNPSTADADIDDPTIRRCMGFSRAWGADGIRVVNLFALRATDPKALLAHPDPVGPENDWNLEGAARAAQDSGGRIIAAWGAHGMAERRAQQVRRLLGVGNIQCLGVTGSGAPKHPLYVKGNTELMQWWGQ